MEALIFKSTQFLPQDMQFLLFLPKSKFYHKAPAKKEHVSKML